jgi:hypothetical protein
VLLSYWFEIQIIDVTGHCSRVRVKRCPHSGTGIAAASRKLVFLIYFLWHSGCGSYQRSKEMARDPPCWERDMGRPQTVIKENEICVEKRFEHP